MNILRDTRLYLHDLSCKSKKPLLVLFWNADFFFPSKGPQMEQLLKAVSQPPVPWSRAAFMGTFVWGELDDDSGHLAAHAQHSDLLGEIVLDTLEDPIKGIVTLSGTFNHHAHPCRVIPITVGSNGGMTFQILCQNNNKLIKGQCLWKRSFCKRDLSSFIGEIDSDFVNANSILGSCPNSPAGYSSYAAVTIEKRRGKHYLTAVSIDIPFKAYDEWLRRMTT